MNITEAKEQNNRFLPMLLGKLAASLLGSALTEQVFQQQLKEQLDLVKISNAFSNFN